MYSERISRIREKKEEVKNFMLITFKDGTTETINKMFWNSFRIVHKDNIKTFEYVYTANNNATYNTIK